MLARLIPNAQLRMIDEGHLFMVTRPAETAAIVEAFLNDDGIARGQGSSLLSRAITQTRRIFAP